MIKTKKFVKPSYIIHHSKNQLGNTLIPVIIALVISDVASIAFLRQGADLSAQAKVL
jgi:Tfp pilus assembly protein PilV